MPLHDWAERKGWDGVRLLWMCNIARDLKARLPAGYRAYVDTQPPVTRPSRPPSGAYHGDTLPEPDYGVEVPSLEDDRTVTVTRHSFVVAVIELISPRNKATPSARRSYARRCADYLRNGINVLLVDVHPRPAAFSFSQLIGAALRVSVPALPSPSAVSYGLAFPLASGGRMLDLWHRTLVVGDALPAIPLALLDDDRVSVELDATYTQAAADCYME